MSRKIMNNRISLKDFAMELNVTITEEYRYNCGHSEYEEFDMDFAHLYTIDEFDDFYIDEESAELILVKNIDIDCDLCELAGYSNKGSDYIEKVYCRDMPSPIGFENVTKYHGLAAYSGAYKSYEIKENAIDVVNNPEWEICCATRAIGPVGLVIDGKVLVASNIDLCTEIDKNGRYFVMSDKRRDRAGRGIINDASQLEKKWDHDEIVVTDNKVAAIWIKDWAIDDFKDTADELCELFNVKLEVIETEAEYDDGL